MSVTTVTTPGTVEGARIDQLVTSGVFELDGGSWDVDNNVWILGDDSECVVFDAPHSAEQIVEAVGGRTVRAILCTHAHSDHINQIEALAQATGAPIYLHPDDKVLWDQVCDRAPDHELAEGDEFTIGGVRLQVLHTPGHSPGGCCFVAPQLSTVISGDTLFNGGPGATGRSYSDFGTIVDSIRTKLLTLPDETLVLTGHGDSTTIGAEAPHVQEWLDRGH